MKRWIYSLVVSILFIFLCLSCLPLLVSAQADTTGQLTVNGKEVTVALKTTKGLTETITSLRMQLYISVETGTLKEEPKFTLIHLYQVRYNRLILRKTKKRTIL
jgi:hypothetical protein